MSFYTSIAEYYDSIFPYNESQKKFISSYIKSDNSKILDIGCSTGSISCSIAHENHDVDAIDMDKNMIIKAMEKRESYGLKESFENL